MPFKMDLTPDSLDLVFYAGDIGDFQISFVDAINAPIDISSYTWVSQIRTSRTSNDPIVLTIDTSLANVGLITVNVPATTTRILASDPMNTIRQWDIRCSLSGGSQITILQGTVTCSQDVTR